MSTFLFSLKKFVGQLCFPLPLSLCLLAVALFFAFRKKVSVWVRLPLTLAFVILCVASFRGVASLSTKVLETQYPPLAVGDIPFSPEAKQTRYIVVLGGGATFVENVPPASRLSSASLGRLVEGLRLAYLLPHTKLVFSGGLPTEKQPIADSMSVSAMSLGMDPARIITVPTARDTAEEAQAIAKVVGKDPFILVTSATHIPRAMRLFQALGMKPIAAPAQYIGHRSPDLLSTYNIGWDVSSLEKTTGSVYEYLGSAWA